jgi:hypothetical protein
MFPAAYLQITEAFAPSLEDTAIDREGFSGFCQYSDRSFLVPLNLTISRPDSSSTYPFCSISGLGCRSAATLYDARSHFSLTVATDLSIDTSILLHLLKFVMVQ